MPQGRPQPGEAFLASGVTPTTPGAFVHDWVLAPRGLDAEAAAAALGVGAEAVRAVLADRRRIDQDLAERLAALTGTSRQLWLNVQAAAERAGRGAPSEAGG